MSNERSVSAFLCLLLPTHTGVARHPIACILPKKFHRVLRCAWIG